MMWECIFGELVVTGCIYMFSFFRVQDKGFFLSHISGESRYFQHVVINLVNQDWILLVDELRRCCVLCCRLPILFWTAWTRTVTLCTDCFVMPRGTWMAIMSRWVYVHWFSCPHRLGNSSGLISLDSQIWALIHKTHIILRARNYHSDVIPSVLAARVVACT